MHVQKIFWFDDHIGKDQEYADLKALFTQQLSNVCVAGERPVDPIDDLILTLKEMTGPISFSADPISALEMLQCNYEDKHEITIICSATFGRRLIPLVEKNCIEVSAYYIFCADIAAHKEWAMDLLTEGMNLQMFDHQDTLLVRLAKDFSAKFINIAEVELSNNPRTALKYARAALDLGEVSVKLDTPKDPSDPHRPFTSHRQILNGDEGLIARAEQAIKKLDE